MMEKALLGAAIGTAIGIICGNLGLKLWQTALIAGVAAAAVGCFQ